MIFDHVSVSWGRDESFSINGPVSNVTISDSIIAQGLETHSCGGLIQTDGGVSILRTLYIDNNTRNPKVKGVNEFINNVVGINLQSLLCLNITRYTTGAEVEDISLGTPMAHPKLISLEMFSSGMLVIVLGIKLTNQ